MQSSLIGYFYYKQKETGIDKVLITVMSSKIPESKGSGYYTKNFYCNREDFPQITQNKELKAGKVEIITDAWNSNVLEAIYNI